MKPSVLLTFYRVMAYVTAILLIGLCVAVILKYGWPDGSAIQQSGEAWTTAIGIAHGWLYMLYLVVALLITRMLGISAVSMLLVLLAGTVPFGAFFAERKVVQWFHARPPGDGRGNSGERNTGGDTATDGARSAQS
ncbi:integral membrane protein [Halopolyspora algeriensis]|uniref:Integral membrane protein n=1 Tax=Halopolyspora algeriensis TaxID=1500506 RepID=A0A368VY55_9ACTN|nr:DUF3817 domain-containing protein [Halopolyspora algeriensis]RCW45167.1 integral membrane protein [Halopolyspora algeriensis]TQM53114.1 integral membrane protein [Halopolyspora algeriensis]